MSQVRRTAVLTAGAQRVGIIGGGFSGAAVAVQLARRAAGDPGRALELHVVEPRPMLGGGVAYSAVDPAHRTNVPAVRMSVFADDPLHFDRWLRAGTTLQDDPAAGWTETLAFPQRGVFGRYVAHLVDDAGRLPGVTLHHHVTRAEDIRAHASGYSIRLATGDTIEVDALVVAVSHPPPSVPAPLRAVQAAGAPVIANPWSPGALDGVAPDASVLIIGTGLTMADVVATLDRRGHRGRITALSRRGLLSREHQFDSTAQWHFAAEVEPPRSARVLVAAVRREVARAAAEGLPWQIVFDDVRLHGARLWAALPMTERRRIVRHLRPYWDVHRFRIAPQIGAAIARLRDDGRFAARSASLLDAAWDGRCLRVRVHPRHAAAGVVREEMADVLVITTGPAHAAALTGNPALAALHREGLVQPDRVGLGIEVDALSRAVGGDGTGRDDLFIAGPLARGQFGELMGLPQVSTHAAMVADQLHARLRSHAPLAGTAGHLHDVLTAS